PAGFGVSPNPSHVELRLRYLLNRSEIKKRSMKNPKNSKKNLSPAQREALLGVLQARFEKHPTRHKGVAWAKVQARLEGNPDKLWSLNEMERTGGEPDV